MTVKKQIDIPETLHGDIAKDAIDLKTSQHDFILILLQLGYNEWKKRERPLKPQKK